MRGKNLMRISGGKRSCSDELEGVGTSVDGDVGIGAVASIAGDCCVGGGWVVSGEDATGVEHEAVSTMPTNRVNLAKGAMNVSCEYIVGQTISFGPNGCELSGPADQHPNSLVAEAGSAPASG